MISENVSTLWAKYDRETEQVLALPRHLEDAACVARILWKTWLSGNIVASLSEELGDSILAPKLLSFLAMTHDVGKASAIFQMKAPAALGRAVEAGFDFPVFSRREQASLRHEKVSHVALSAWLRDRHGWDFDSAMEFSAILGGHHGNFPPPGMEFSALGRESEMWRTARSELIDWAAEECGLTPADFVALHQRPLKQSSALVLTGLVIMCDWIASNVTYFPFRDDRSAHLRAETALTLIDLPPSWNAEDVADLDQYFTDAFALPPGAKANPVQQAFAEAAASCDRPSLLLLEAQMGYGKTEAAFVAAHILAARFGYGGVTIGLPTRATSDAMWSRAHRWVNAATGSQRTSLTLTHSSAELNEEFRHFKAFSSMAHVYDDTSAADAPVAHWWLRGRKKSALASFTVGTIDQVLFAALRSKHTMLRHLGLAKGLVIIDEIHASDEYSSVYLDRVLQWCAHHGISVIGLSATLPPARRGELLQAYQRGAQAGAAQRPRRRRAKPVLDADRQSYPLISVIDSGEPRFIEPPVTVPTIRMTVSELDDAALVATLRTRLQDGGIAAVICNTVRRAQEAFTLLSKDLDMPVELLHSRYMGFHRRAKEAALVQRLSPSATARPHALVIVSTQIIEQSLDIDVDLMITDIAPSDLIFQRSGRLHRHRKWDAQRPALVAQPHMFLRGITRNPSSAPRVEGGSAAIYGRALLLRTLAVLDAQRAQCGSAELTLRVPDDIAPVVRETYSEDLKPPEHWDTDWHRAEDQRKRRHMDKQSRAEAFLVAAPTVGSLVGWSDFTAGEADDDPRGQAMVRDIDGGIDVVVVQCVQGEYRCIPFVPKHGGRPIDGIQPIDDDLARALLTCTVQLPLALVNPSSEQRVIDVLEKNHFPNWEKSHWLKGTLALVLDENYTTTLDGKTVSYDKEIGLMIGYPADGQ